MNLNNRLSKYLIYPIAWILTIVFLVYIFPSESKYDIPGNVATGLFVVTLVIAAFNYGIKKRYEKEKK